MEKINVAKLLRNCPKGMELDCTMFDDVTFERVDDTNNISIKTPCGITQLSKYGCYHSYDCAKCIIYPKGKTTWEGFHRPFKDGDIIYNRLQKKICIYYLCGDEVPRINGCRYNESNIQLQFEKLEYPIPIAIQDYRFATEEEKAKLFKSIRDNGYKWNPKTKTLENLFSYNIGKKVWVKSDKERKYIHTIVGISRNSFGNLEYEVKEEKSGVVVHYPESLLIPVETKEPKFKVGDKIFDVLRKSMGALGTCQGVISEITDDKYIFTDGSYMFISRQDDYELVPNELEKLVEHRFKVGDRIRHKCPEFRGERIVNIRCDTGYFTTINDWIDIAHQDDWELVSNIEPNFKIGDIIQDIDAYKVKITEINIGDECYGYESIIAKGVGSIPFNEQDNWKLVEPEFKVWHKIKSIKTGNIYEIIKIVPNYYIAKYLGSDIMISWADQDKYELVQDKFDINTLVPYESRVLARDNERGKWIPAFWGFYDVNSDYPYKLIGCIARYCIPYEGNEHLRGKTDDCDKYFKTWE